MSDESMLAAFGITEAEARAVSARLNAGEPTEQDLEMLSRTMSQIQDAMNAAIEAMNNTIFGFTWAFDIKFGPTYRTEPITGAELGGQPRNLEDDVIDEIDRLVDWQMEEGKGW